MPRLSLTDRSRVIQLWREGKSIRDIARQLEENFVTVSESGIRYCIRRFQETGLVGDRERPPPPMKLQEEHKRFIDEVIEDDCEISAADIAQKLFEAFSIRVHISTVKRARQQLGWRRSRVRYGQLIRNVNKTARLAFCLRMYELGEEFANVIWTDESTFWVERHARDAYHRRDEPRKKAGRPKNPASVHVWGGISRRGATKLVIFEGIMRADFYVNDIVGKFLLPFIREKFPDGARLMQDNDPKHTSRLAIDFLRQHNVDWWKTPAESPDLNPIEHIWGNMKVYLRRHVKPRTKQELVEGLQRYWANNTTAEKLAPHLDNSYKAFREVIRQGGDRTKY